MSNIWVTWGEVFRASLMELWVAGFVQFFPKLLIAIILFIVGWVLGSLVAKAFEHVFAALKIDNLFQSIGAESFFRRAGMSLNVGYFVGQVIRWFVIVVFLLPSLSLVGLEDISNFLREDVLGFLPKVVVAALILIIATLVADFLSKAVVAGAKTMSVDSANMLGAIAKYAVWIFALIIALGQLGVASTYMATLFAAIVGMLALAGGLAFGLGGRDAAARFLSKVGDEMSHK